MEVTSAPFLRHAALASTLAILAALAPALFVDNTTAATALALGVLTIAVAHAWRVQDV